MASAAAKGAGAVLLLCGSNAFMSTAWYLHLKFKSWSLVKAIFLSWLIAFFEYCLQVPANRMGHFSHGGPFTAPQLKIIQEFISLTVFAIFAVVVLKEKLRWVDLGAFVLIMAGVALGMVGKPAQQQVPPPPPPPADAAPPAPLDESGRRLLLLGLQPQPASGGSGGGGSEGQGSPTGEQAGLPSGALHAVHELRGSGSARVLLAYDSDLCAGSSHQGVRRREPTYDVEAGGSRGLAGGAEQAAASDAPWEAHAAGGGGEEAEAAAAK